MSKYKRIETLFRDPESLLAALQDAGRQFNIPVEHHQGGTEIRDYHSNRATVEFVVRREHVVQSSGLVGKRAWGDFGLARTAEGVYEIVQDNMDGDAGLTKNITQALKQRYAYHQACKLAKARGLTVVEEKAENGVLRLKLRGYQR